MNSGVAGWTRESRWSHRFSNMGGEARSWSVRVGPREEASMPPIVPQSAGVVDAIGRRAQVLVVAAEVARLLAQRLALLVERARLVDRLLLGLLTLVAHRCSALTPRNSSIAR